MRAILFLIACAGSLVADEVTIPVVGQPERFFGAAGHGVTIKVDVEPTTFTRDEYCTLTLRVAKLLNAPNVRRPNLEDLDDMGVFKRDFQAEALPDGPTVKADERVFRYRLRPRRSDIAEVPGIVFRYYDSNLPQTPDRPGLPFRTAHTDAIPITVTKPADPPVLPPTPLEIPAFAESLDDTPEPWATPKMARRVLALLLVPFGLLAFWLWRQDEGREGFQRRQRHRVARRTTRRLDRDSLTLDELRAVMNEYHAAIRADDGPRADEWAVFVARIDEFRFGPGEHKTVNDLRMAALDLVRRWEER
ncbi:BatD family protein [Zavarzinella formosa]|uniref:BatD family protein n=1 Tax=Zavarzinella formosa TaxID=360055 RepID=UPI0003113CA6|nr:BatD family protein [Zavarzinella formosa]